jgi:hypothetical protein
MYNVGGLHSFSCLFAPELFITICHLQLYSVSCWVLNAGSAAVVVLRQVRGISLISM